MKRPGWVIPVIAGLLIIGGGLTAWWLLPPRSASYFSDEVRLGSVQPTLDLQGVLAPYGQGFIIRTYASRAQLTKTRIGQTAEFTMLGDPAKIYRAALRSIEAPVRAATPNPGAVTAEAEAADETSEAQPQEGEATPEETAEEEVGSTIDSPSAWETDPLTEETRYLTVLSVLGSTSGLSTGQAVQVRILFDRVSNIPVIPRVALGPQNSDGSYTVQAVQSNGRLTQRRVSVGLMDDLAVEVKDGLELGDRVVTGQAVLDRPIKRPSAFSLLFKSSE